MAGTITISIAPTPPPIATDGETLRTRYRDDVAAFRYEHTWSIRDGDLTIQFIPRAYIRNDIAPGSARYSDAVGHEQRHDRDFRSLVPRFERELRRRLRGMDLDSDEAAAVVRDGLGWLAYRYCLLSRAYHRSIRRDMIEICQNLSHWPD